jgi:hypothetical protein
MGFCGFCGVPKLPLRDNSADGTAIAALRLDTSLRRSFSIFFCWLLVAFFETFDRVSILLWGDGDDLNHTRLGKRRTLLFQECFARRAGTGAL